MLSLLIGVSGVSLVVSLLVGCIPCFIGKDVSEINHSENTKRDLSGSESHVGVFGVREPFSDREIKDMDLFKWESMEQGEKED